jgi:hypothetical protein
LKYDHGSISSRRNAVLAYAAAAVTVAPMSRMFEALGLVA